MLSADEIERTADRSHVAGLHLGRVGAFLRQIFVDVAAFHDRRQEHRVHLARRLLGGGDMLGRLNHRHVKGRIVRQSDLRSWLGVGADRLHAQAVREHAMVAHLVHLSRREL